MTGIVTTPFPEYEKCECGHDIMHHYLADNAEEMAGCIISDCECKKYRARGGDQPLGGAEKWQ